MKRGTLLLVAIMFVLSTAAWAYTPIGNGCHYTPGYWKNHPQAWPTTSLMFGGVVYNQTQLIEILSRPVRGDATVILAHHLIAAILNVDNGGDMSISAAIAEGVRLLSLYPIGSNPSDPARQEILDVKDLLCAYNEMRVPGCK